MLPKLQQLKDLSKQFKKKYPNEIHDIILFGSVVKEKLKPEDIDVCIISFDQTSTIEKIVVEFGNKLGESYHVVYVPFSDFPEHSLFKTIIHEGISMLTNKPLNESLGFDSRILFWYDLLNLNQTEKVKFFYALKGRKNQTGILKKMGGQHLGKGVLTIPTKFDDQMQEFFKQWKVNFNRRRILLER